MSNAIRISGIAAVAAMALLLVMLLAAPLSAETGGRYFISGDDAGVARALVGVRHNFDNGFTQDLTDGQLRAIEMLSARLDITVAPVALYELAKPPGGCEPWPECKNGDGGGDDGGTTDPARPATPSDQTPWGIEMIYNDASVAVTSGGAGVDVAVLDTGVNADHLDLVQRVEQCKDFTHKRFTVRDGCDDNNGHGTHVAGTILADGGADGLGIYGVAPEADLFAYKVCGNNGCWSDDIAAAIEYAADNGAEIISMSLGGDAASSLIDDAIVYATGQGVLVVAAAGNDGPADGSIDYPGGFAETVAVGALDSTEAVPDWSSRGVNDADGTIEDAEVEFGAPGVSVESAWNDGTYNTISGTSMATPHVSGFAAKYWQGSGSATRTYLHGLVRDVWTAGEDTATGLGLPYVQ